MTPFPPVAEPEPEAAAEATAAQEILDQMATRDIEALAALAGAPAGVAELAFNAFLSGTRMWVITYGLATEQSDCTLAITDLGRQAIESAAERCPQPYLDVSLEDVMASTRDAITELVEQSGVRIRRAAYPYGPRRDGGSHDPPRQSPSHRARAKVVDGSARVGPRTAS